MATVGTALLLAPGFGAAGGAAIALPTITVLTDPEQRVAAAAAANPLPENDFARNRHARPQTGLDNGSRSWQVKTSSMRGDLLQVARPGPGRLHGRVPLPPAFDERSYTFGGALR
jgi:hypothetical protein